MLFNSVDFLIFFPIVTILYFALPFRARWVLLLLASCGFYMAFVPKYILILLLTIIVDYFAAIEMEKQQGKKKRIYFFLSLATTFLILFFFKYFNFFNANVAAIAYFLHWNYSMEMLKIILPIGLSFHTFQGMSYIIEVYRGRQKAERHFGIYALYVMFYPQLVAGPIERPQNLLHQFHEYHPFDYKNVTDGLKLMAWGMFKKVVIADRLAVAVNLVYSDVHTYSSLPLFIATLFFTFQIYCDFSGYSDIARGAAQVMGFSLMKNFDRPYFSKSISEFWKRWHISLSTWFRDYLYIPLKGNRAGKYRWYANLFIVFLVSGLWHGANWTYVIWGGLHGFYLIVGILSERVRGTVRGLIPLYRIPFMSKVLRASCTFILVLISWIFFRANTVSDAFYVLQNAFAWVALFPINALTGNKAYFIAQYHSLYLGLMPLQLGILSFALSVLLVVHILQREGSLRARLGVCPIWVRWSVYYGLVMSIILFGYYDVGPQQFIYFQF